MFNISLAIAVFHFLSAAVSLSLVHGHLPPAVQLGGAIVAAVEQDAEQEAAAEEQHQHQHRVQREWLQVAELQLQKLLNDQLSAEELGSMLDTWMTAEAEAEGRGKHQQKKQQKKLAKMLYPVLAAAAVAKIVLLPLVLKWLTALSTSSFVMGKIALATSGLLALKWIMSSGGHARDRLEIIHSSVPAIKGLHAFSAHGDLTPSDSSWMPMRPPYIPLGVTKEHGPTFYKPFL
ncbi:uncharacterized protein LOC117897453 [Drosophila subobscura]|uniref:uncharacterized protein LOC117897453 n=1 Tax=Drosophila subobscura TaxID=7241 RepID=UPI00155B0368|nr:uncharacterized protein LOC117897453 [Drosophila subobscura]